MEETVCVFKTVRIVLLNERNIKGEIGKTLLSFSLGKKKQNKLLMTTFFV